MKMKRTIVRLAAGTAAYIAGICANAFYFRKFTEDELAVGSAAWWCRLAVFGVPFVIIGGRVLLKAMRNIARGKVFDENFLMALASVGAFAIGEYLEAIAVMLFYQVGELFEDYAVGNSRKSIAALTGLRPDYANLKVGDKVERVEPRTVRIGDIIVIKPGERVPLDGKLVKGETTFDTAALTGEAIPVYAEAGSDALSGTINLTGLVEAEVTKEFENSTVNKILELTMEATDKKSKTENFITRFAAYYTPVVVLSAVVVALVPFVTGRAEEFSDWLYRALNFLVVSCPCALVISVPLSFFGGIGGASKCGLLVKGSNYLEAVSKAEYVVMDKTGTLTKGRFAVAEIRPSEGSEDELLKIAALAEYSSTHPISRSVVGFYEERYGKLTSEQLSEITDISERAGLGVSAKYGGLRVLVGNMRLLEREGVIFPDGDKGMDQLDKTAVRVAAGAKYIGSIFVTDELKDDAKQTINGLESLGIKTVMLTGDNEAAAREAALSLGVNRYFSHLMPAGKVEKVEELLKSKTGDGKLLFVGDGINDAPVLARADIGVAMGGLGSDAAIEAADIIIMTDEPSKLLTLMKISKKTVFIVKENIAFALAVKAAVLILSLLGFANMWAAVFADVGVSVIAILNALRALKVR